MSITVGPVSLWTYELLLLICRSKRNICSRRPIGCAMNLFKLWHSEMLYTLKWQN